MIKMRLAFILFVLIFVLFMANTVLALPNPAAVYCEKLGYEYRTVKTPQGKRGVVIAEPGVEFGAWDFFKGKVGNEYAYGALYGYDTECVREDKGTYVTEYAVCVRREKKGKQTTETRIPMLDLMEQNGEPLIEEGQYRLSEGSFGNESARRSNEETEPEYSINSNKGSLPSSFCWTNKNGHSYIGPIRDQGGCGSCYAFGACAAAEGTYNWAAANYDENCTDFSESFIVWCIGRIPPYNSHLYFCVGADYDYYELKALTETGVCSEADFAYTETDPGSCTHWGDPKTVFSSWHRIPCNDIDAIKTAIMTYGVVDAALETDTEFMIYAGDIYSNSYTNCPGDPPDFPECYYTATDHIIALVGWDDNGSPETNGYWILRNSWNTDWGENGYMRIKYTSARVACEVCYLTYSSNTVMGTPYSWLASYFTNNYDVADTGDADNDGLLTWEEYVAGTDPTNAASVFAILAHGYLDSSNYVTWYGTTNSGVTGAFGMRRSTNLSAGTWDLIPNSISRAASGTNTWWDTNAPSDVSLFYCPIATNIVE